MKRFTLLVASIVALVATSCVQADVEDTLLLGGDELVTISLEGPTMGARAEEITIGKGLKATQLQYAIYDEDWNCLKVVTDETFDSGLKKELKLRLVKNKTYNFVFWAQAPNNSYYTVNLGAVGAQAVEPTISVAYGTDANDDYRDAFFGNLEHKVEGSAPVTVYLKRPFAQINFGTNDVEEAKAMGFDIANATTSFKVVAHDTLNLKSGLSSGDVTVERTFVANELPENKTLSTDAKGDYHWVAMNYILWPDAENLSLSTCEMTIEIAGQQPIVANVPNAPARRNWRTNLVGSLLTQEGSIFVEIVPETVNDYNGVIEVRTAEQFNAAFADPEVDFIVLADDITLTTSAACSTNPIFTVSAGESLTIDLNNHRLTAETPQLFDVAGELVVKNGTIENTATDGKVLANDDDATLSNVTILQTTDSAYYDEQGGKLDLLAEGVVKVSETEIAVTASCGMSWFDKNIDAYNGFEGITIKLETDVDLSASSWDGIGDGRTGAAFKGTFDGQDKVIYGAHFSDPNQFTGGLYGDDRGLGLFSVVDGATIKNINLDNACFASYTIVAGGIAAYAKDTTFENIKINNSKFSCYNWTVGGVVGQAEGTCTFKGIEIDSDSVVGSLWDSHGTYAGGIAGWVDGSSTITIEDCTISCVLDVINDVTSNYKWCIYRIAGMIIGDTDTTEGIYNDVATATVTNVTCKNVTVNYGQWMNYHYCQGYWGRGWGRVESSDYIGGVDHTQCNHPEGEEHCVCFPFDQLFGGGQNGTGHYPIKGIAEFPGVTVNYPAEYTCPICGEQHNVK